MYRRIVLLALTAAGISCATQPPAVIPQEPFPIHAWIGPPSEETTVERYRELRDAGFTHSFSGYPDNDANEKALDVAGDCGIKLFVATRALHDDTEGTVRRFMNHPSLAGYHLVDEPNAKDFPGLGEWTRRIRAIDDDHFCYINIFPNYANEGQLGTPTYREHVERFVAEVPVQVLSFDHYPVVGDHIRPEWYENLEIIAEAARDAGKPFWAFALAVAHDPYPIPTIAHLRVQVYSNLVYGAQGIQYFTYWTPQSDRWNFHEAPIRVDGTRSPVYDLVKAMNSEIKGLSGVFAGANVLSTGHTGAEIPRGTKRFSAPQPFSSFATEGTGAVVSLLEKGNRRFLAAVNRDINGDMKLSVSADSAAGVGTVGKDGSVTPLEAHSGSFAVMPGDIVIFTWEKK
jgi:hypothetical protein